MARRNSREPGADSGGRRVLSPVARPGPLRAAGLLILCACVFSCSAGNIDSFAWRDLSGSRIPFRQAESFPVGKEGVFSDSNRANRYILAKPAAVSPGEALQVTIDPRLAESIVEISVSSRPDGSKPFISGVFALQRDASLLVLPLSRCLSISSLALKLRPGPDSGRKPDEPVLSVRNIVMVPAMRGFDRSVPGEMRVSTGFRYRSLTDSSVYSIETPFAGYYAVEPKKNAAKQPPGGPALVIDYGSGGTPGIIKISAASRSWSLRTRTTGARLILPVELFSPEDPVLELALPKNTPVRAIYTTWLSPEALELADLGRVVGTRADSGASVADYALYRWDILPDVLVFDFRDYATQDRYLKRLAFFVEKRGFVGRLASDSEIGGLHGWNAHDYRPEDLAAFFSLAAKKNFPLNDEEKRLASLLVERKLLVRKAGGEYSAGRGAFISITRESEGYLRSTFITHESTHALFFADRDYRDFVSAQWTAMPPAEKWFWKLYFGWMNYNTASDYLMANEYQAYLLQQPVYRAKEYFTKTLPDRLVEHHPELVEPIKVYMQTYGEAFPSRATRLQTWVEKKYGITAGRSYFLY